MNQDNCCDSECAREGLDPNEPCWGKVDVVDEWYDGDDFGWIHACQGHEGYYWDKGYKKDNNK